MGALTLGLSGASFASNDVYAAPYALRKKSIETDVLVVGGGTAGVVAAIQAGRAGQRVTLIECASQLGGTTTTAGVAYPGIFFAWGKQIIGGIGWEMVQEAVAINGDTLPNFSIPHGRQHWRHQVRLNGALYAIIIEQKCLEAGVDIRFYETPTNITFKNGFWHVETIGKGIHAEIKCKQLIDCSGNAYAASMAGYPVLREAESQPGTLIFTIGGYDFDSLDLEMIKEEYEKAIASGELVRAEFRGNIVGLLKSKGDNIQHVAGADATTSESHTLANIQGRESLLKHLKFLKRMPGCEEIKIVDMRTETGVRETYRIEGEYQITHEDYVTGKLFSDAISYSYYPIDLHIIEHGVTPKHLADGVVATVPLRALIPKNSQNFLVAGRCLSSDRLANSALRVQASCMGMGQAAGAVASLAITQNKQPKDVTISDIHQLVEAHGGIVPGA
ncbi:FAD dependent oxidoreductase [Cyclobacterium xiamenense]|uniref:FAD dependent oxidoreductase n=2 Tax=Cyclobacterium xiamenense TaxID=1297121 RepID=A0A1H7A5A7_9BACT|nr:FAD dependent oxidoreductase [Cyclobacterium xiamenense]